MRDLRQLKNRFTPFKSKHEFVNLIFANTKLNELTYIHSIIVFLVIGLVFIALSIFFYVQVSRVLEYSLNYYTPLSMTCPINSKCQLSFEVTESMKQPVYVMYELANFNQNHRKYIQSKNNAQLAGATITIDQAYMCSPFVKNSDFGKTSSWGGTALDPNAVASPCGSIAYTYFNDTFTISNSAGTAVAINETGISWPGDKGGKFKQAQNSADTQWINPEDEHFIVWMRTSGLPNFKKLWGRIEQDLPAGSYKVLIQNNYNSVNWAGNRYLYLTTKSIVGGKNFLLPTAFLVVGVVCIIAAILFWRRFRCFKVVSDSSRLLQQQQ